MYIERIISHNWLIHRIGNRMLQARLPALTGVVLDIGCGERPFEADILRFADAYYGLDWSNSLHTLSADAIADANRPLPIRTESVDHVVSFEVLEHLSEPDVMLTEAFRVLKHGGRLTISVPFQWWLHEAPWDYQRFTRYGLEYHLRKAGFSGIDIHPRGGFWTMWLLKLNYQLNRLPRGPAWIKWPMRALLVPVFMLNQAIAPLLDRIWPDDRETAGYFATAHKHSACGITDAIGG